MEHLGRQARTGLLYRRARRHLGRAGTGRRRYNDIRKQFPYLISGGIAGLALVVIGVGLLIIQSQRADRVQLEANLTELRLILERVTAAPAGNGSEAGGSFVVAGPGAYHRPTCKLVAGRDLRKMTPEQAVTAGLDPCRTCRPAGAEVDLATS